MFCNGKIWMDDNLAKKFPIREKRNIIFHSSYIETI